MKKLIFIICFLVSFPTYAGVTFSGASTNDSWRVVFISDTHMNKTIDLANHILPDAVTDIVAFAKPDMVVFLGDIVEGCTVGDQNLQTQLTDNFMPSIAGLYTAGISVYAIRGNHEACVTVDGDAKTGWTAAWTAHAMPTNGATGEVGFSYSFTHNNANFIMLDQFINIIPGDDGVCCSASANMNADINQTWLNTQLAANTSKHLFVVSHIQNFNYSSWLGMGDVNQTERNAFWASLVNAHTDAFIGGNSHVFNIQTITKEGDAHSVYHVLDGAGKVGDVGQTYPYTGDKNSPYTLTAVKDYHNDALNPFTGGLALGYIIVEINGKGSTESRVTYTFRHATWNALTSHWTFSNYTYHPYSIDDN